MENSTFLSEDRKSRTNTLKNERILQELERIRKEEEERVRKRQEEDEERDRRRKLEDEEWRRKREEEERLRREAQENREREEEERVRRELEEKRRKEEEELANRMGPLELYEELDDTYRYRTSDDSSPTFVYDKGIETNCNLLLGAR